MNLHAHIRGWQQILLSPMMLTRRCPQIFAIWIFVYGSSNTEVSFLRMSSKDRGERVVIRWKAGAFIIRPPHLCNSQFIKNNSLDPTSTEREETYIQGNRKDPLRPSWKLTITQGKKHPLYIISTIFNTLAKHLFSVFFVLLCYNRTCKNDTDVLFH